MHACMRGKQRTNACMHSQTSSAQVHSPAHTPTPKRASTCRRGRRRNRRERAALLCLSRPARHPFPTAFACAFQPTILCICICMHACMDTCVYVYAHTHIHTRVQIYLHNLIHIQIGAEYPYMHTSAPIPDPPDADASNMSKTFECFDIYTRSCIH